MARTYKRDSNGRFAGGGGGSSGGGSKRPAAKTVSRGVNRLTRDNAGKITSVGGTGATARGGRLKTAAGNKRAMQTAKVSGGRAKGTISKKPRGISDSDKQSMQMAKALRSGKPNPAVDAVRRRQENSAASRRQANSLAKGNLLKTTEADRRNRAQSLATAQRKLSEMERTGSGLNRLSGSNTALLGQRAQVAALSKPLPEFRKPNRSDVVAKNRDALARRRAERQNAKTMSDFRARTSAAAIADNTKKKTVDKPAAGSLAANKIEMAKGRSSVMQGQKDIQNQKLREINAKIKEAGPNAGAYRLQKLQIQSRLQEIRSNLGQAQAASKPAAAPKSRASQMRERAAQLDQRGNALMSGGRRDTAAVNLSLNSRARRNETNAGFKGLEMTRNAERLRSKADRIEYRSNESRAKKLRSVYETPIAKAFAKKAGKSVTEVRAAIRSMTPEKQIKMFKQYVKENRTTAKRKP